MKSYEFKQVIFFQSLAITVEAIAGVIASGFGKGMRLNHDTIFHLLHTRHHYRLQQAQKERPALVFSDDS